jgi:hypothetical protein
MTDAAHYQLLMTEDALAELAPLFDALAAVAVRGEVPGPELLARVARARSTLAAVAQLPNDGEPYSRSILRVDDEVEIMLARWRPGHGCAPHDHGGAGGFVIPVKGAFWSGGSAGTDRGWSSPSRPLVPRAHRFALRPKTYMT